MPRRYKSIFAIVIALSAITLMVGCSQTDDIITSINRSEIFLSPERLPSNPSGMIYTLWVGNEDSGDTAYIGMFGYDQKNVQFLNENGEIRPDSNFFVFDGDLFSYTQLFVAIDTLNFSDLDPGPVMLVDDITDPAEDQVELRFPQSDSLWNSTVRYNMETTTDGDSLTARIFKDGFGIWFSAYRTDVQEIRDTFALTSFSLDSVTKHTLPTGTTADTSIVDTANYSVDTTWDVLGQDLENEIFALDTFRVIKANFDYVLSVDTDSPWVHYEPVLVFHYDTANLRSRTVDLFSQDDFGLIDYSALGWKYKGWIVSPNFDTALTNTRITLPAWLLGVEAAFPGADGGMITTGTFGDITQADDDNPYSSAINPDRVPTFPGEDFLEGLPVGLIDPTFGLMEGTPNNLGTVFLSLEPENFNSDTTNFPLLLMVGPLPTSTSQVIGQENAFTLSGKMQTNDQWAGFPSIKVKYRLY